MLSFGDIVRGLFGGSKTQQQSQATSTPSDLTPDEFSNLRGPFADALLSSLTSGGPQYGGPLNAPIGANEQTSLNQLMGQTGPNTDRQGYLNDVIGGKYLPGSSGGNPFLDAAIREAQRPTLEGLTDTLTRALPGRFTAAGQFTQGNSGQQGGSSAFDRAAALASNGAANALAGIATNMSYQGYNDERNRQQSAVQLDQAEVDTTIKNLQAQALPRLIQEVGIERGMQLFQTNVQSVLATLQLLAGVTQPHLANTSQQTSFGESTSSQPAIKPLTLLGGPTA